MMSYISSNLLPDEELLYRTQLHWICFAHPILFGCFMAYFFGKVGIFLALCYGITIAMTYISSEFGVTNKRVLIKVGFIRVDSIEILLAKVESIQVHQSILGRLLGYGSLVICGTGSSRETFHGIDNPLEFRRRVLEQVALIK